MSEIEDKTSDDVRTSYSVLRTDRKHPDTHTLMTSWTDEATARKWLNYYRYKYGEYPLGAMYPNGKGVYEFIFELAMRYDNSPDIIVMAEPR
jgi:hypothetical protein